MFVAGFIDTPAILAVGKTVHFLVHLGAHGVYDFMHYYKENVKNGYLFASEV